MRAGAITLITGGFFSLQNTRPGVLCLAASGVNQFSAASELTIRTKRASGGANLWVCAIGATGPYTRLEFGGLVSPVPLSRYRNGGSSRPQLHRVVFGSNSLYVYMPYR